MNEEEDLFNTVFKKEGGIFNIHREGTLEKNKKTLQELKDDVKNFISFLRIRYPSLPSINFNFIDNRSLNACADIVDDRYYVGVNFGVYLLITDMFSKMLATKSVFPHVGNINIETDEKKTINRFTYLDDVKYNQYKSFAPRPKDELRLFYARALSDNAMRYLIYHEIGHIVRGHCGYYKFARDNESSWNEFEKNQFLEPLHFQTMEMDADFFAVNFIYEITNMNINGIFKDKLIPYPLSIFYKDLEAFFSYWVFSIYSFFRLCNFEKFDLEETKDSNCSHPPPSVRVGMIINNIIFIMIENNLPATEEMTKKLSKIVLEAEAAFAAVSFEDNNPDIFILNLSLSREYKDKLRRNLINVLPLIKPFSIKASGDTTSD
jgi:hypothetical protein